jgi:hypothetical protein
MRFHKVRKDISFINIFVFERSLFKSMMSDILVVQ